MSDRQAILRIPEQHGDLPWSSRVRIDGRWTTLEKLWNSQRGRIRIVDTVGNEYSPNGIIEPRPIP